MNKEQSEKDFIKGSLDNCKAINDIHSQGVFLGRVLEGWKLTTGQMFRVGNLFSKVLDSKMSVEEAADKIHDITKS